MALNFGFMLQSNEVLLKIPVSWVLMGEILISLVEWSQALDVLTALLKWLKEHVLYSLVDLDLQVL